jgi:hypothetical protein
MQNPQQFPSNPFLWPSSGSPETLKETRHDEIAMAGGAEAVVPLPPLFGIGNSLECDEKGR